MMFGLFSSIRLIGFGAAALAVWFAYGWGSSVIQTYNTNIAKVERLQRDNALILSRVASYKTLLERRDAAIAASKCREQIQKWIKNPESIPGSKGPFPTDSGG